MASESKRFFHDSGSSWEEVWPGIARKVIGYDDRLMMVKVKFTKGTEAPMHNHPHSQTSYVESGEFEVTIDNETKILKAGDAFYVSPGVMHGVNALDAGVVIDAFSPHREDFLA